MKLLTGTVLAAAMLAAMPAFADRGDHDRGHGRGHDRDKHHWKQAHRGHHRLGRERCLLCRNLVRHRARGGLLQRLDLRLDLRALLSLWPR